ncbi:MAG: hypothetical protein HY722_14230, partial [Planctomycetes bacterium]|nr:hypothetical protein [Planctomycetota bacterium]
VPTPTPTPVSFSATITKAPGVVDGGSDYEIHWKVNGIAAKDIDHNNVHWGTDPKNLTHYSLKTTKGFLGLFDYRSEVTAPAKGTVYFQVHLRNKNGQEFQTPTRDIRVREMPQLVLDAPAAIRSASAFNVAWRVDSQAHLVKSTYVTWGSRPGSYLVRSPGQKGGGARYTATLQAPLLGGTVHMVAVAEIDGGRKVMSAEQVIRVDRQTVTIAITRAPQSIREGDEEEIQWEVSGAQNITENLVVYGTDPARLDHKSAAATKGFLGLGDWRAKVKAPSGSMLHYRVRVTANGQVTESSAQTIRITPAPFIKLVHFPADVASQVKTTFQWEVGGGQRVTTRLKIDGIFTLFFLQDGTKAGGAGTYSDTVHFTRFAAGKTATVWVEATVDGKHIKSAKRSVTVRKTLEVQLTKAPQSVKAGEKFDVKWELKNVNKLDRTLVRWGTATGSHPNEGQLITKKNLLFDYKNTLTAPANPGGRIYFIIEAVADGDTVQTPEQVVRIEGDPRFTSVQAPGNVGPNDAIRIEWEIAGAQQVSETRVHYTTSSTQLKWFWAERPSQSGGSGTYRDNLQMGSSGLVKFFVSAKADGKDIETKVYEVRMLAPAKQVQIVDVKAPGAVKPGAKFQITWELKDARNIAHNNVHWGTTPGNYTNFGPVLAKKTWFGLGDYYNDFTAPATKGPIYFVVHTQADGGEKYSQEYVINVR